MNEHIVSLSQADKEAIRLLHEYAKELLNAVTALKSEMRRLANEFNTR
jgi:hypothetical protein